MNRRVRSGGSGGEDVDSGSERKMEEASKKTGRHTEEKAQRGPAPRSHVWLQGLVADGLAEGEGAPQQRGGPVAPHQNLRSRSR